MKNSRLIGEGAEAIVYSTNIYGNEIIVKYRQQKRYRIKILDDKIRKSRTKKEAKILAKASECGIRVPRLVAVGRTSIYMEKLSGTLLKDKKISQKTAETAGELLAKLHNSGITHGDFTPANLIENEKYVYVIDFGLSDNNESSEERALDILLMKRQISKELYLHFIYGYSKNAESAKETLRRLDEVEERGRYQVRTLV